MELTEACIADESCFKSEHVLELIKQFSIVVDAEHDVFNKLITHNTTLRQRHPKDL